MDTENEKINIVWRFPFLSPDTVNNIAAAWEKGWRDFLARDESKTSEFKIYDPRPAPIYCDSDPNLFKEKKD